MNIRVRSVLLPSTTFGERRDRETGHIPTLEPLPHTGKTFCGWLQYLQASSHIATIALFHIFNVSPSVFTPSTAIQIQVLNWTGDSGQNPDQTVLKMASFLAN